MLLVGFRNILQTEKLRPTDQRLVQSCTANIKQSQDLSTVSQISVPHLIQPFPSQSFTLLNLSHLFEVPKNFYFSQASEGVLMSVSRCFQSIREIKFQRDEQWVHTQRPVFCFNSRNNSPQKCKHVSSLHLLLHP